MSDKAIRDDETVITGDQIQEMMAATMIEGSHPTQEQIDRWKKEYPNSELRVLPVGGDIYVFRTLDRAEYYEIRNTLGAQSTPEQLEEHIVDMCVLWPIEYHGENIKKGKAGVPSVISDQVFFFSGFEPQAPAIKL